MGKNKKKSGRKRSGSSDGKGGTKTPSQQPVVKSIEEPSKDDAISTVDETVLSKDTDTQQPLVKTIEEPSKDDVISTVDEMVSSKDTDTATDELLQEVAKKGDTLKANEDIDTQVKETTAMTTTMKQDVVKSTKDKKEKKNKRKRALPSEQKLDEDEHTDGDAAVDMDTDIASPSSPTHPQAPTESNTTPPPPSLPPKYKFQSDGKYRNKQRCLTISTRGVSARYRHLLEDLRTLIPHNKKDSKLDPGKNDSRTIATAVNDICEITGCNSILFMECRKKMDGYMWISRAPHGPSVKFELANVHTMDELRLTGNGMKGSRPVLTFDESFERLPHLQLIKGLFLSVFGTPRGHPKSKPFVDRVMGFYYADKKIWVRHYQIIEETATNAKEASQLKQGGLDTSLVEIGPRFVLNPIRIFGQSLFGETLWANPDYLPPTVIRQRMKRQRASMTYEEKVANDKKREEYRKNIVVPVDPLKDVFR